jgi:hypothetical protein
MLFSFRCFVQSLRKLFAPAPQHRDRRLKFKSTLNSEMNGAPQELLHVVNIHCEFQS